MKLLKLINLFFSKKTCDCGENKKCVRKIHSIESGGLFIIPSEHFSCGKIKSQIQKLTQNISYKIW